MEHSFFCLSRVMLTAETPDRQGPHTDTEFRILAFAVSGCDGRLFTPCMPPANKHILMHLRGCSLLMKQRCDWLLKLKKKKRKGKKKKKKWPWFYCFICHNRPDSTSRATTGASRSDTDTRWRRPPRSLHKHLPSNLLEPLHVSYFTIYPSNTRRRHRRTIPLPSRNI